jgi:hypothetical protein
MTPDTIPDLDLNRIFSLMDELEAGRQPAIDRLLKQRAEIDDRLKRLGYTNVSVPAETPAAVPAETPADSQRAATNGTAKVRKCGNCGKPGHDHRSCPKSV